MYRCTCLGRFWDRDSPRATIVPLDWFSDMRLWPGDIVQRQDSRAPRSFRHAPSTVLWCPPVSCRCPPLDNSSPGSSQSVLRPRGVLRLDTPRVECLDVPLRAPSVMTHHETKDDGACFLRNASKSGPGRIHGRREAIGHHGIRSNDRAERYGSPQNLC